MQISLGFCLLSTEELTYIRQCRIEKTCITKFIELAPFAAVRDKLYASSRSFSMSRTNELLRQMMHDPTGKMLRPVRKTVLVPQPDGSVIRRMTDKAGNVTEDTISTEQRLSLDARTQLEMSQQQFAAMLGISVRTLHDWEQGRREPSGAARTLLKIAARHPEVVREIMQSAPA